MLQSHKCAGCAGYNNALDCAKVKDCILDKTNEIADTSKIDVSEKENVVSRIERLTGING